jgi:hypothetical protein
MASLIPGYEYDLFMSYSQKDNKYDLGSATPSIIKIQL